MASPTQYELGEKVTAGADGTALMVSVTLVAGPGQLLALVSVTKTVRTIGAALLKPNAALVGVALVAITVDRLTSLYQV